MKYGLKVENIFQMRYCAFLKLKGLQNCKTLKFKVWKNCLANLRSFMLSKLRSNFNLSQFCSPFSHKGAQILIWKINSTSTERCQLYLPHPCFILGVVCLHFFILIFETFSKKKKKYFTAPSHQKKIKIDSFDLAYDDGKWHHMVLTLSKDKINFTIDSEVLIRALTSKIKYSTHFLLGGGRPDIEGFVGCMKNVEIMDTSITVASKGNVNLLESYH